jgi:hypothetical protein
MHAAIRLTLGRQTKDINLSETIHNVYEAKISSEGAPGVGKVTDIAVLNGKGVTFVNDSVFDVLSEIHKERPALSAEDRKKLDTACKEYRDDQPTKS